MVSSIGELLHRAGELTAVSDTARLDTEILLGHVLGVARSHLLAWPERQVPADTLARFEQLFQRRLRGEPIAYLVGTKEFWSLALRVNASVLIPRPDTELLVRRALDLVPASPALALDLGTGSGAIALALASERPLWNILAVDCSVDAIAIAEHNRCLLGLDNVRIARSDWFDNVGRSAGSGGFHLIVANPPYLDADDPHLARHGLGFEPRTALVAADAGLADLRAIVAAAPAALADGGWLLLEHGDQQGERVRRFLTANRFNDVATHLDLAGRERVSEGRWCAP